jgi:hypothetical protein
MNDDPVSLADLNATVARLMVLVGIYAEQRRRAIGPAAPPLVLTGQGDFERPWPNQGKEWAG